MSSVRKIQQEIADSSEVDLSDYAKADYKPSNFSGIEDTLTLLAVEYIEKISDNIDARDVVSSGFMQDNITPTAVENSNGVFSVGILAPDYMSYQDEGVNGWAVNRNSRFAFRTKGVDPAGDMVNSLKKWVKRTGIQARNVKVSVTSRERKGRKLQDANTRTAIGMAYAIKKHGLEGSKFFTDATDEMEEIIADRLGESVQLEIVKTLLP